MVRVRFHNTGPRPSVSKQKSSRCHLWKEHHVGFLREVCKIKRNKRTPASISIRRSGNESMGSRIPWMNPTISEDGQGALASAADVSASHGTLRHGLRERNIQAPKAGGKMNRPGAGLCSTSSKEWLVGNESVHQNLARHPVPFNPLKVKLWAGDLRAAQISCPARGTWQKATSGTAGEATWRARDPEGSDVKTWVLLTHSATGQE